MAKYDQFLPVYSSEELASEEWRVCYIDGERFSRYAVSNLGRVRNNKTGRILKPLWTKAAGNDDELGTGIYWRVWIYKRRKKRNALVHRLVAEVWVPGRTKRKKYVHHKDNISTNPRANNLEWVTQKRNIREAIAYYEEMEAYMRMASPIDTDISDLPPVEIRPQEEAPF